MLKKFLLAILFLAVLTACRPSSQQSLSGYIEANLRYLSSSQSGDLLALKVSRGQCVTQDQILFQIDRQPYADTLKATEAAFAEAEANLKNSLTGERPSELAEIQARIVQAKAQLEYANKQLYRNKKLVMANSVAQQDVDKAQRNVALSLGQLKNLQAQLVTAKLPQREQLIKSAQASVAQAKANVQSAQWTLGQTAVKAPVAGCIFDNYYWPGEQVPANQPVVSLLVPSDERVIFYVPEELLSRVKLGQSIQFTADGTPAIGHAVVRFISPQAEYTPPVIYSNNSRQKLIYRVEAAFSRSSSSKNWHPGQLLTVKLPSSEK